MLIWIWLIVVFAGKPHSLPITLMMRVNLERRYLRLAPDDELLKRVSAEHVHTMAMRLESPQFMLYDLRKLLANLLVTQQLQVQRYRPASRGL